MVTDNLGEIKKVDIQDEMKNLLNKIPSKL